MRNTSIWYFVVGSFVRIVSWYCGWVVNKLGNNVRTTIASYAHNAQFAVVKNVYQNLCTSFEHILHTVLHTKFLQFVSVNQTYTLSSTGPIITTILYK